MTTGKKWSATFWNLKQIFEILSVGLVGRNKDGKAKIERNILEIWEMLESGDTLLHNFVPQLATWRVVIGNDVLVDRVKTHSYQLQLTMWRIVTQNYAKISITSISYNSTVHVLLFWLQFHLENYIIRNTSLGKGLHRDWEFSWHAYVKIFLGSELPNCLPQLLSTFNSLSLILHSSFIFYVVRATCCEELMKMPFVVPVLISLSACCCLLRSLLLINSTSIMW